MGGKNNPLKDFIGAELCVLWTLPVSTHLDVQMFILGVKTSVVNVDGLLKTLVTSLFVSVVVSVTALVVLDVVTIA
jgi:hypothetical protein